MLRHCVVVLLNEFEMDKNEKVSTIRDTYTFVYADNLSCSYIIRKVYQTLARRHFCFNEISLTALLIFYCSINNMNSIFVDFSLFSTVITTRVVNFRYVTYR